MKHTGGCHCGKVRYEVEMNLEGGMICNCSMCQKKGTILTFAPMEHFHLLSGREHLKDYQFNKKVIHHLFCTNCGVTSFAEGMGPDGKAMAAINIRCLDNIDTDALEIQKYDGKNK